MLNASLPFHFYAYVRAEFLRDFEAGQGQFEPALVFGVSSHCSRALGWHVLTESGATFWNLPIHALAMRPDAKQDSLSALQPWDCFSENVAVTEFKALRGLRLEAWLEGTRKELGAYLFTVDWYDNGYSHEPEQAKCAHVVQLDNGNLAALPNNRVIWFEASFTTSQPNGPRPDYKVQTRVWRCEKEKAPAPLTPLEKKAPYKYVEIERYQAAQRKV